MQKSWEGYRKKNWMHFVYKMDNSDSTQKDHWWSMYFLCIFLHVYTDENSYVTPALHFFKLITTPDFFCVQYAPFKATSSTFNPFWHHLLFFMHLQICFELNDPEIEKHYKWTLKRLKLSVVSSFHPHSMCEKVERVTTKTGCTLCTN